ncbi:MAG: 50S ribosomal protein L11 methyltransferase [Candidatus Aenigmatarchaeota archaeon]
MLDIIGSREKAVAIIEKGGKKEALELMERYANVKSVLKKLGGRSGVFRIYKLRLLAGEKNTEVVHREYGMLFRIDPRKAYFSPREAEERQRIAALAKDGERILVMFSGIAPYAIAIAKQKNCEIVCVEINKKAVEYADENLKINKFAGSIENICADIKKVYKKIGKFDRILMPLPETAEKFLPEAFAVAKKGAVVQLYGISEEKNLFADVEGKAEEIAKKIKVKYKITGRQKVLPFGVRMWKVRIDLKII